MTVSDEVCTGYFECLNKLWTYEELCDFTVQICDVSIKCHRVILGACSPFFLGLLRSGMKEANEGRVVLQDISVSTFQLILKTLYTGEDVLSLDNFIEIWHAAHMLQIGYLIQICEDFAIKNLSIENFKEISLSAQMLDSHPVILSLKNFAVDNFDYIYATKFYLELSADEILNLVRSQTLRGVSEHHVLQMVLNWAEHKPDVQNSDAVKCITNNNKRIKTSEPLHNGSTAGAKEGIDDKVSAAIDNIVNIENIRNDVQNNDKESDESKREMVQKSDCLSTTENSRTDRINRLEELLTHVRTCIISPTLLMNVLEHRLIRSNDKAKQIIVSAILKQASFRHGQWPTAGIYRTFNEYGNYGVYCLHGKGIFQVLDPYDGEWFTLKECSSLKSNVQLVAFENELYATGIYSFFETESNMMVFSQNSWKEVANLPGVDLLLVSNEQYIYITDIEDNVLYRLNPKTLNLVTLTNIPTSSYVTHVMSYQMYLLFFCTERVNDVEETAVHMLDLQGESWTRLDNFEGQAENIISFRNDDNHFVLQTNGSLWSLNETNENIAFTRIAELWSSDLFLYGAVVYDEKLVIFYQNPDNLPSPLFVEKLDGIFSLICYWETQEPGSNFIPAVLPKSSLFKYVEQNDDSDYFW